MFTFFQLTGETKKILVWDKQRYFTAENCPLVKCVVTEDKNEVSTSDAIIFTSNPSEVPKERKPHQVSND